MENRAIAQSILSTLGGKDNIIEAHNCMTRLRLQVTSVNEKQLANLKSIPGVLGINNTPEELQIILGPGKVQSVSKELQQLLEAVPTPAIGEELHQRIKQKNSTPQKLFLKRLANIFLPLIPGFIACGLITGILNSLLRYDPGLIDNPYISLLGVMGNAVFFGMNIFIGINAAKEFGGTPTLGGILAIIISHPALASITLWEQPLQPGRGGIISVLLIVLLATRWEKFLQRIIPTMFNLLLTPLLVILVMGFVAIMVLQPVGGFIASGLTNNILYLIHTGGPLTGFLLASLWLPIVMTGLHQAITPIHVQLLQDLGNTPLLPILAMAGGGQIGAALAVFYRSHNTNFKKTILTALPVGIMGIGEPLIYGVTLPLFRPFLCACVAGGCGGAFVATFAVGAAGIGVSGLPLAAITNNIPVYLGGLLISYLIGFVLTCFVGFDESLCAERKA